jgi:hypothetical protein
MIFLSTQQVDELEFIWRQWLEIRGWRIRRINFDLLCFHSQTYSDQTETYEALNFFYQACLFPHVHTEIYILYLKTCLCKCLYTRNAHYNYWKLSNVLIGTGTLKWIITVNLPAFEMEDTKFEILTALFVKIQVACLCPMCPNWGFCFWPILYHPSWHAV